MNRFAFRSGYILLCAYSLVLGIATVQGGQRVDVDSEKQQGAFVNSKPVLKRAMPETLGFDHWAGSSLRLTIEGEYKDLYGLRIREKFVDVNGTIFTLIEDYPVWIDSSYAPSWGSDSVDVHLRQYKDEKRWRKYIEYVHWRGELTAKSKEAQATGEPIIDIETKNLEMPPVWISVPEPNKVRVFVSVYDKAGNESEAVEIKDVLDWLVSGEDNGEFSEDSDDDYFLSVESELGAHTKVSPLDVNNAALLYYQALLSRPQPDAATGLVMNRVLRGGEPDRNIRRYLKKCRQTIKLTEAATLIPQCTWGASSSGGLGGVSLANVRQLSFLLSLYAHTLATDGQYRMSLESSLSIRRLARHVGDGDVITYLVSLAIERRALFDIKYILGVIPPDTNSLVWLQGRLAEIEDLHNSFMKAIKSQSKHALHILRNNPNAYKLWRRELAIIADLPYDDNDVKDLPELIIKKVTELRETWKDLDITDEEKNEIRMLLSLTDEQLLERSHLSYEKWLHSAVRVLESDIPYEEKYSELQRMEAETKSEPNDPNNILYHFDPNDIFWRYTYSDLTRIYDLQVQYKAELNALKAAIEVYLIKAKTGRLPDSLPADLPKDPFSDKDFLYEITKDGFRLSSPDKDIPKQRQYSYEFRIKR